MAYSRYGLLLAIILSIAPAQAELEINEHNVCVPFLPLSGDLPSSNLPYDNETLSKALYDTLVVMDAKGELQPGLAQSWQVSDDGLMYSFRLRSGVPFHSVGGFKPRRTMNASDVAFSFNRLRDGDAYFATVGTRKAIPTIFPSENIRSIFADGRILGIRLHSADGGFLAKLSAYDSNIMSLEYAQFLEAENNHDAFAFAPVGTGPFQFVERSQTRYSLQRFEHHWRGASLIRSLSFQAFADDIERLRQVRAGNCNHAIELGSRVLEQMTRFEGLRVDTSPFMSVFFLAIDAREPPWNDVRARKALSLAINRERILKLLFPSDSGGYASTSIHPKLLGLPLVKKPEFDPDRAKILLQKVVPKQSINLKITSFDLARPHNPDPKRMAQLVAHDLKNIGIDVDIEWVTPDSIRSVLDGTKRGTYEAVLMGYSADLPVAMAMAETLLGCIDGEPKQVNFSRLCDPQVLSLLARAARTKNSTMRQQLYRAAANSSLFKMQYINLIHAMQIDVIRADLTGIKRLPTGLLDFRQGRLNSK